MKYERRTRVAVLVETPEQALEPCPQLGCHRMVTPGWLDNFGGCTRHRQFDNRQRPFDRPTWAQLIREQKAAQGA